MLTSSALHLGSTSPESEQAATDKGAKLRPYSSCALHKVLTSCLSSYCFPAWACSYAPQTPRLQAPKPQNV